ncbi:gametocyte-specific factor 1 isoform X2 [Equus przewalskii]|uniref:Gametocyte-specific factor 1 isoform X2 n=1 Tax=Equus przewalskii TaxID=9798 RepID=A0ABM4PEU6_EQUPR|nr:gametocyte-specific factor 1 isoform X2 [Equus caballus]
MLKKSHALGFSFFISIMEKTYIDSLDPEKLLQCPYDKNHQIRACRFPYHLVKCRKNHPDVANKLATCPFNARHQVPRAEISHHISSCDDKSCIEQDVVNQTRNLGQETLAESTWQCPPCDEDWDKDLWEQTSTPFVWGTTNYCGNNSPASNIVMEHKSNLASGMRVPKSLPYVLPWKNNARPWKTLASSCYQVLTHLMQERTFILRRTVSNKPLM